MGKFNMDAIKKGRQQNTGSAGIYGNGTENNNSIKVGSALLDLGKAKEMETIYVKHEQIRPSADNKWSMNQEAIRQLADWIKDVGLLNPLILRDNKDGTYTIVAGERRYRAIGLLIQEGSWDQEKKIKAHKFEPELIELPLQDKEKEEYIRQIENCGQRGRNTTDGDLLQAMRSLKKIYASLREKGELSGVKTRALLAEDMNISQAKIAQLQKVENQGSEMLQEALLGNAVSVSTAVKIADFPEEKQDKFLGEVLQQKDGKQIERVDVLKYQHKEENPSVTKEQEPGKQKGKEEVEPVEEGIVITAAVFRKDIRSITKKLKEKDMCLQDEQYETYLRLLNNLKALFN